MNLGNKLSGAAIAKAGHSARSRDSTFSIPRPARENSLLSCRFPEIFFDFVTFLDADWAAATFAISTPVLLDFPCVSPLICQNATYDDRGRTLRPCTPDESWFLALNHRIPGQMWVIAHREELIDQAVTKIRDWNPSLIVDKEMAGHYANPLADVIVSCVASIGRKGTKRSGRFDWDAVTKVVIDESTPARGGRQVAQVSDSATQTFQSTPARGGRQTGTALTTSTGGFNPRPRAAGDIRRSGP